MNQYNLCLRMGHHSTSDDSIAYRSKDEIDSWSKQLPIDTFRQYLECLDIWNQEEELKLQTSMKKEFLKSFAEAEKKLKSNWQDLFFDVYHDMPNHIK